MYNNSREYYMPRFNFGSWMEELRYEFGKYCKEKIETETDTAKKTSLKEYTAKIDNLLTASANKFGMKVMNYNLLNGLMVDILNDYFNQKYVNKSDVSSLIISNSNIHNYFELYERVILIVMRRKDELFKSRLNQSKRMEVNYEDDYVSQDRDSNERDTFRVEKLYQ